MLLDLPNDELIRFLYDPAALTLHLLQDIQPDERREIVGEYFYKRADQLYGSLEASKIAGILLEFSYQELEPLLTNPSTLDNNIRDAHKMLANYTSH